MKRIFILIFFQNYLLLCGHSQNLLFNGGFEKISACPSTTGLLENAINWYNPNVNSPDLYNICSSLNAISPPDVFTGYENPAEGACFAAIGSDTNWRDYIETVFLDSMILNWNYCVNLFISHADSSKYFIDSIDIQLSDTFIYNYNIMNQIIQINKPTNTFYANSIGKNGWININFIYQASGGEKYITIGNLDDDANTIYSSDNNGYLVSYYFIDSVSISQCRPPILGSDSITINEGDQIILGDTAMDVALYSWSPSQGLSNPSEWQTIASPAITTTYQLTKITPCDTTYAYKTVVVNGTFLNSFPNPAQNFITYSYGIGTRSSSKIKLFDYIGRLIYQETILIESGTSSINIDLASGVYVLRLESGDEILEMEKVIIMK